MALRPLTEWQSDLEIRTFFRCSMCDNVADDARFWHPGLAMRELTGHPPSGWLWVGRRLVCPGHTVTVGEIELQKPAKEAPKLSELAAAAQAGDPDYVRVMQGEPHQELSDLSQPQTEAPGGRLPNKTADDLAEHYRQHPEKMPNL